MKKRNLRRISLAVATVIIALPLLFIFSVYAGVFGHLQTRQELISYRNAEATRVMSSDNQLIGRIFTENRTNIAYNEIPQPLIDALVATEDSRFYQHKGIDARSLLRVFFKSLLLGRSESGGGSTISQQLAKNMFGRSNSGRLALLADKTKEAILAHRLETTYSKEEILTFYLNTVSFGENIYGIETASQIYFSKDVRELDILEAAVLIGMLKANTLYNPRLHPENALARRNVVIRQMEKYGYLSSSVADSISRLPLKLNYNDIVSEGPADYFMVRVKSEARAILEDLSKATGRKWNIEEDGLTITTTLNLTLQKYVLSSFREHLPVMQKRLWDQYRTTSGRTEVKRLAEQVLKDQGLETRAGEINLRQVFDWKGSHTESISVADSIKQALLILHAGLIALDPVNGAIRAWVGGVDFRSEPYDQIYARRQLASAFKPVLYAGAFETGIEPCHYLDNDSIVVTTETGDWSPSNYDHTTGGKYSLAGALAMSMNIPTFNLFTDVGFDNVDSLWRKLGFTFQLADNPSLALGTAEASLLETAVAYSAFANGGFRVIPQSIVSISTADGEVIYTNEPGAGHERVLSERSAMLVSAILQKAVSEGTGASMGTVYGVTIPMAGKTGTSQDYSDAWFAAFNPGLVLVARAGASSRAIHFNNGYGSGSALALPLVALTLKKLQANDTLSRQFALPFPELPAELKRALDCPDFRENNILDKFRELFQKKKISTGAGEKKAKKKEKGFFRRLFGRQPG